MTSTDLLIHIGYQKTGTTWLQKQLFTNHRLGFHSPFSSREISEAIVYPYALTFDPESCRKYFTPGIQRARNEGLFPVLSRERLSGSLRGGGYDSRELADRLATVFPGAKVLIVIREQKQMLRSSYGQTVKGNSCLSLEQFLNASSRFKQRLHLFDISRFQYHYLIKYYYHLFGEDNVLVLPYEMFQTSPRFYIKRIVSFCGIDVGEDELSQLPYDRKLNSGLSTASTFFQRWFNYFFVKDIEHNPIVLFPLALKTHHSRWLFTHLDRYIPQAVKMHYERKLETTIARRVQGCYGESNAITQQLIKVDLSEYGYDMPR
jgi:hypothetical protein